jgi:hypothetical protein
MIVGIVEDKFTATSWYRTHGVFAKLCRRYPDIQIKSLTSEVGYRDLVYLDVILLSRPNGSRYLPLIDTCKQLGIKVWIDFDDDVFSIPYHNPAYFSYKDHDGIRNCIKKADIVTASTDALAVTLLENGAINVHTVHNCIELLPYKEPILSNRIAWRGSTTHVADLEVYKDIFARLSKKYELVFYGYAPHWKINFQFVNGTNLFDFYNTFYNDNLSFVLTPLENCKFNYSKSNIAWLEATNAGAVCFTNLTTKEWQWKSILKNPEILLTKSKEQLVKIHKQAYELSRTIISQQYNIEDASEKYRIILYN